MGRDEGKSWDSDASLLSILNVLHVVISQEKFFVLAIVLMGRDPAFYVPEL